MKNNKGLGRGLDSLFAQELPDSLNGKETVLYVRLSDVEPDKNQPRKTFDGETIKTLADSISEYGILQPLVVMNAAKETDEDSTKKKLEGKYRIVSGERRWRAAKLAGLHEVPVIVRDLTEKEADAIKLVENIQREDLNAVETARGLKKLIDDFGLTHEETAKAVGLSRSNVTNFIRLLALPENTLDFLASGDISAGHARALLPLEKEDLINETLDVILARGLSVRETEKLVNKILNGKTAKKKDDNGQKKIYLEKLQERISSKLGRKAYIKGGRKGRLEIEYYGKEDLEALLVTLCGKDIFKE
ncbi:MAG: ParB/RepB/Spo0J family partition protein [Clostridia bacterium]|nr:ParB/RepB/Spo0J family partition protein [Clostridia bacterium]MBR4979462.1 ParB/RepB/Spo0J family partition protein [Clostridia bacterium]